MRGQGGIVSATVSAISVQAGLETLRRGGNAADAAQAVALTQITTQLGSVVSYAGIMTLLYYDAKSGRVSSLDAGYNSYRGEHDPGSIPASDLSALMPSQAPVAQGGEEGRKTLVPGFMAGMEALHDRFGHLPFGDLFAPAIWYADHGVTISPNLAAFFSIRRKFLSRTQAGLRFLHQAGNELPQAGDIFRQPELAATLRAVARDGASYMYGGEWAKAFVAAVQADGGKATVQDLADYRASWNEPAHTNVFGHTVYAGGAPNLSAYQLLTALNVADVMHLDHRGAYWRSPRTFRDLARICDIVTGAPAVHPSLAEKLAGRKVNASPESQRTRAYADALTSILRESFDAPTSTDPHHSNSIVVVDAAGNIAALTHTINAVIWGDTGIVVGGVVLPDSAGFQQMRLAAIKPGERLPNEIADTIVLDGKGRPVLATASIGSALLPETLKEIVGAIGQRESIAALAAAPPLLTNLDPQSFYRSPLERRVTVPVGAYDAAFLRRLEALGMAITQTPAATVSSVRGTLAVVAIDPLTAERTSPVVPGIMVLGGVE